MEWTLRNMRPGSARVVGGHLVVRALGFGAECYFVRGSTGVHRFDSAIAAAWLLSPWRAPVVDAPEAVLALLNCGPDRCESVVECYYEDSDDADGDGGPESAMVEIQRREAV